MMAFLVMKILMVCLGNICRSPMADGLLRQIAKERDLDIEVDSAGTSNYHEGEAPDSRMIQTGKENHVDISFLRARQFVPEDLDQFDLIFAMDMQNLENIKKHAAPEHEAKINLMLNEIFPGEDREVPDPYFGGNAGFQHVYDLLKSACTVVADKIEKGAYR